jgi:divalent metal cation (Fe/Co/Zn/Cd) transporter
MKLFLYLYCQHVNITLQLDTLEALAEDHLNDVMSNTMAVITAYVAVQFPSQWYIDPSGAILISFVIIYRWGDVISDQIKKIVGHTAPQGFIDSMNKLAEEHDLRIVVDVTRAYHFGAAFNVEMEIVLPATMTVMESHDIALALQHRIEERDMVERAFVHVSELGFGIVDKCTMYTFCM